MNFIKSFLLFTIFSLLGIKGISQVDSTKVIVKPPVCGGHTNPPKAPDTKVYSPSEPTSLASFPGGKEAQKLYFEEKLSGILPPKRYRIAGKPYIAKVTITIEKDGSFSDIGLLKRSQVELDKETQEKVIAAFTGMPNWIPTKLLDEPKRSRYIIPITLNNSNKSNVRTNDK